MTLAYKGPLDRLAVNELIVRGRAARDAGLWAEMGAFYYRDSSIDISWFIGTGAHGGDPVGLCDPTIDVE